jgi:hypothetical protein
LKNHTLFDHTQLKEMQATGQGWPAAKSEHLADEFSDRFAVAESLFDKLDTDLFLAINDIDPDDQPVVVNWQDPEVSHKSYATRHQGPCFGFDVDTMYGPVSWYEENGEVQDYVQRRKLYIYDWTSRFTDYFDSLPELKYFAHMHDVFKPVLEYYRDECFGDQAADWEKNLYKLMIIQYTTPTATDETRVLHRKHNTERFGDEHCDETLGGLHLGENYVEFQVKNPVTGSWDFIPCLAKSSTLWFFGEYSERSGWSPTYHRMTHNRAPKLGTRYSIIFDLQARYKGEQ